MEDVEWFVVVSGNVEYTGETAVECVNKRDEMGEGRVVSTGSTE